MSDQWGVAWSATARRQLGRLPDQVAAAAIELIYGALADSPPRVGRALRFEFAGHHRARRGDYRVVYTIDSDAHRVTIRAIEHRSDVYRQP